MKQVVCQPLWLILLAITIGPAAEAGWKTLPGHVPAVVAHLRSTGRTAATNELRLAIGLPLHDPAGLAALLAQLYDPASPNYRRFLTPEQFSARFGPTAQDYARVREFARTNGLAIVATHGNRLLLDVQGPAAAVERAFHVTLHNYRHPSEARNFFAPAEEPSVDASLPIADISGLENYTRPHPQLRRAPAPTTHSGSAPDGNSYLGADFRNAYLPGGTLDGSGQTVGVLQFEGYYSNDIAAYAALAGGGRTNIAVQPVYPDGAVGLPDASDTNGILEASLDIEMAMSMAPGLSGIVVFEGSQGSLPNDILNAMAASNTVKNLSSSWGWVGGPSTTTDNIFQTMAAQGQSFFNAAGDSDAFPAGVVDSSSQETTPASSPYITQVGGTTLQMSGSGSAYLSEKVWNWGTDLGALYDGVGGSGGVSAYYPIPAWQEDVSFAANGGSPTARNIPDVALIADGVYVLYNQTSGTVGGTSCAAPLWAGFMALVNQQAAANGQPPVGFINPAVYEMADESIYSSLFHDITAGNNTWSGSPNAYYAVPGYDLCTGLGTPNGTNLINAFLNPDPLVINSNSGFQSVGAAAGTFTVSAQTFSLTNAGTLPLAWSLINTSLWLDVSVSSGTLAAGAGSSVVVRLNPVATNLNPGVYSATLWFTNLTSGVGHARLFGLQTADPLLVLPTNRFSFFALASGYLSGVQQLILTNARGTPLDWSLNNTSAWFSVSPAHGHLEAGTQTNVLLALVPTVTNLSLGTYQFIYQLTNLTSQSVQTVTGVVTVADSLVQNGGFETGDFTGWTLYGDTVTDTLIYDAVENNAYGVVHSGNYGAFLGDTTLAILEQEVPTSPGQEYLLSFWLVNAQAGGGQQFQVDWNTNGAGTNTLFSWPSPPVFAWTNFNFVVTATSTNATLQFGAANPPNCFGLDDVSLMVIPTPAFASLIPGTNGLVFSWNTLANVAYQIQYKTNLIQASWLNLGNPITATAGTLTLVDTNRFNSRQRFYRIAVAP